VIVKEIYAPIMVNGRDDPAIISKKCASQVTMGIDYKTLTGRWANLWNEREPKSEMVEVFDTYAIWYLDVTQDDFTETIRR
jgi:hypothetical protein